MTPELIQYLIYAGMVLAGYFLRHKGISIPLLPGPEPTPPSAPTPQLPDLQNPLVQGLLILVKQILEKETPHAAPGRSR